MIPDGIKATHFRYALRKTEPVTIRAGIILTRLATSRSATVPSVCG